MPIPASIEWLRRGSSATFAVIVAAACTAAAHAASTGYFTAAQASRGQTVYTAHCASCHAANLTGQAGPALAGATFQPYLTGSKTAYALYDFIAKQMPVDKPASLPQADYLAVTAFILQRNGYSAGTSPLSITNAKAAPLNVARAAQPSNTNEIVRVAPPQTTEFAPLPAGADVNVTDDMMAAGSPDGANWLLDGRTYDNQRYSPLTQIDAGNVASLAPVALLQTGMTASFEATPIVIDGVMYLTTPVVNGKMKIVALNAVTGERLWETTDNLGTFQICCGPVNRGVAVGYGKVYVVTLDDRLIALDATNGKVLWNKTIADPRLGYSETMAPQIYKNQIIVGSAGGEWAIRGFVASYNATTGVQKWRWNSTNPKSFAGDSWKRGGGMVWTTPAIDPKLGLLVFSTGNPNPDLYGSSRIGDNLYTDSIVALDVDTGTLKWYYQEVKHDVWDYDAVSPVVLFDVSENGKTVPAAGEAGKVGWVFVVDRATGALIRKSDPYVMMSANMFSTPTKVGVTMLPGANGGAEWSPAAFSPQTHLLYILAMNQLMRFTTEPPTQSAGQIRLGSAFSNVAPNGVQNGPFVALNVDTGKIAWQYMAPQPLIGGALATAGNLVFMGEGNGWFDAFNASTGQKLWRFNLGAGVNAPPITYEVGGTQYVAVAAGGNFQLGFPYGDTLAIFKLAK
ncbi:MAG TPA: PQQ-binding-like beta-propeller repeat protein [Candidatus Acidoferrales bacterium]|jgi:alcohol dehydrogenase (cytochrome c)|nr:PQQ-binding-like beta-propeller repeat protein [Candidatus Acidoferrales bacterium]